MAYSNKKCNTLIDGLFKIKEFQKKIMEKANLDIAFLDRDYSKLGEELLKIQGKCKHVFPDKPTVIGRGICSVCGYNDY